MSFINIVKASVVAIAAAAVLAPAASAQQTLQDLLNEVRKEGREVSAENRQREQEFLAKRNEQRSLLDRAKADLAAAQRRSEQLKASFDQNEQTLTELEEVQRLRLAEIGELFGVVRQTAGEAQGMVDTSLLTAQKPDRGAVAKTLGEAKKLPTIDELRDLQFLLLEEMAGSASVERFQTQLRDSSGAQTAGEVVRVGLFNIISDEGFLIFSDSSGELQVLDPQPSGAVLSPAKSFMSVGAGQLAAFPVDPSGGSLLQLETKKATPGERVQQGGPVGYVIIGLGVIGLLIAVWRLLVLTGISGAMKKQMKSDSPSEKNPLGRILSVYAENRNADTETLELKLDEAIMKEVPPLETGQSLIKVFAAVAPLLGLLGTVVGMIETFQAITLFGTGDPKLMAGGISAALVTTMLGLIVAIPLVFLHTLVTGRSKNLIEVLEEQSAGIIARHSER